MESAAAGSMQSGTFITGQLIRHLLKHVEREFQVCSCVRRCNAKPEPRQPCGTAGNRTGVARMP